jgi:hypothetical protein
VAHVTAEAKGGAEVLRHPHPGCLRVSGKQRTYKEAFLRFGATDEIPKGYATPGVLRKECGSC